MLQSTPNNDMNSLSVFSREANLLNGFYVQHNFIRMQRRSTSWVLLLSASWTIILLLWEVQSVQAATAQEIASLRSMASVLGIPPGVWNFSTDPCVGRWVGVSCCTNNSQSSCCQFPLPVYPPQVVACDTTEDAQISMLLLRSDIIGSQLNGSMTDFVCSFSSLIALDLGLNRLRGQIPPCIGNLSSLQILRLGGNDFNGTIPQELGNLNQLRQLFLDTTMISGAIPPSLGRLRNLQNLVLRSNALEGNIPPEIGQLGSLEDLELQVNKLSGSIPASFKNLRRLTNLRLFSNQLSGRLDVLQEMNMLKTLCLRGNGFTGAVPAFQLPRLTQLDLGFNQFTGGIPDSLGSISALQGVFLGHNRLSGGIPSSLASLLTISYLDLSHNLLNGSLENLAPIGTANQLGAQVDVSFNFFDISNAPKGLIQQPQGQQQTFFNCVPRGSCSQSSPGRSQIFAVNAGGGALSNKRIPFDADVSWTNQSLGLFYGGSSWALELSGTSAGSYTKQVPINMANSSTGDSPDLYTSMRWSSSYIAYHGFGLQPGTYTVSIHFAEIVFTEPGYRMFDVLVQGEVVKKGLDVVKEVGANTAYKITKNTTVSNNGSVSVEFIFAGPDRYLLPGRWDVENLGPMVSAISVVSSDYSGETGTGSSSLSSGKIAGVVVGIALGLLLLLRGCILLCRKRKRRQKILANQQAGGGGGGGVSGNQASQVSDLSIAGSFTYQELNEATKGFSEKLGEGGFGAVYKGTLPNGLVIGVKQLVKRNKQIEEDFKKEISIISKVRHRNLLGIYGYSLESDVSMLVTEYMPNGSLDRWLFQRKRENTLSWEARRNIAVGVACGLAYLHDESKYRIIHCDVKPANILLDADFNPRIADFGLARLYDEKQSHVTATRLKGTAGYLAPEYAMHLQLSDKVDVYSFGVVLLEILSGRRAVDFAAPSEQCVLVDWAHKEARVPSNLLDILDKKLHGQYVEEEAKDMVTIAILCTQRSPTLRPKMQSVWLMLNGTIKVPDFLENMSVQSASSESSSGNAIPQSSYSEGFSTVRRFRENSTSFSYSAQPVTW